MKSINPLRYSILIFLYFVAINIFGTTSTPTYSPDGKSGSLTLLASDCQTSDWYYNFEINVPINQPINITLTTNTFDGVELYASPSFNYDTSYPETYKKTIVSTDGKLYVSCWDGYNGLPSGNVFTLSFEVDVAATMATNSGYIPGYLGIGTPTPRKKLEILEGNGGRFTFSAINCNSGYEIAQTIDDYGYKLNVGSAIRNYKISMNGSDKFTISNTGNVGIGTTSTPNYPLEVNGKLKVNSDIYGNNVITFLDNARFSVTTSTIPNLINSPFSMPQYGIAVPGTTGSADLWLSGHNGIKMFTAGNTTPRLGISKDGKVSIGTIVPDLTPNVLLTVKGTIHAQEVLIDLNTPLADYVFDSSYDLMPLPEVEKFVKTNKHLPEIPSAIEVRKNGLSMGEMQNKLLQKIEELTLYMIAQQKQIESQNAKIEHLEKLVK